MSQFFASVGQSIGVSASALVLPMNIRTDFLQNRLVGSPCSAKDSQDSPTPRFEIISSLVLSFLYSPTLKSIHEYWKNHTFNQTDLCWQIMSLLFNMLSRLVITFLPRSKCLLISCLQSPSAVILVSKKIKFLTVSPSICYEVMGPDTMILVL